jgi:hypothetical protein
MLLHDQWVIEEINEKIKKFLSSNENKNTAYQNLWDTAKAKLRGKFIVMSAYIKNTQRTRWALVAHTCNPSYSGSRDQDYHSLKPAWENSS